MIRRASDSSDWNAIILHLVEDVALRRAAGEPLPDSQVIEANPDLMPELGERLAALRSAEEVLRIARNGSTLDRTSALRLDEQISIPGYNLQELLGRGAMGAVYLAHHTATGRQVAVKVLHQAAPGRLSGEQRFDREARILAALRHPSIVAAHEVGVSQGRLYFVMEYVDGQALDAYLAECTPSLEDRLRLFLLICEGVHAAHLHGVIHRDLKPSNILVDSLGMPRLLDFGLAKLLREEGDPYSPSTFEQSMTLTGQFVGSLPWASPEQVEGLPGKIDLRTDVYALGVILYQMLTRRFPYPVVGRMRDVMNHILDTDPARPGTVDASIPPDVETIVLKCLAKQPQRRYQSARDLAVDITRHLSGEPIEAKRDSNWFLLRKKLRRHRVAAMVGSAFLALSLLFGVVMLLMYRDKQHEAYRAQQTLRFLQDTLFQASSHRLGSGATLSQVLDHTLPAVGEQFAGEPLIEASLRYTIGSALETIWRKQEAVAQLSQALDLQREHLGPDHPETLRTMVLLGMVMAETGDRAAVAIEREALARRERLHGSRHQLVADVKSELAYSLWTVAAPPAPDEAERLYEEAMATYAGTVGEEHANFARCMQSFAFMRLSQGRHADAESLFRRSLVIARRLLGDDHQFTIEGLGGLSDALRRQGGYDEAESLLREVLTHVPRLYGEGRVPFFLRQLAEIQSESGDYAAAEQTYHDVFSRLCLRQAASQSPPAPELQERADRLAPGDPPPHPVAPRPFEPTDIQPGGAVIDGGQAVPASAAYSKPNSAQPEPLANTIPDVLRRLHAAGAPPQDVIGPGLEYAAHQRRHGKPEAAAACLAVLQEIAAFSRGAPWRGAVEMALAELALANGQRDAAARHFTQAHAFFLEDLGENHRRTREAAEMLYLTRPGPGAP